MGPVELKNISLKYGSHTIFEGLNMSFQAGCCTAVLGSSGIGKTSILRLISGQIRPTSGDVIVNGLNLALLSRKKLYALRKNMGYLYQQGGLFPHLSVFENVAFPLRQHFNMNEILLRDVVLLRLDAVGLRGARDLMPDELSGGMKQRVALARATILDPSYLLYDEPFSGQDPVSKNILIELIQSFSFGKPITSILVSHDIQQSLAIAQYVYVLLRGGLCVHGAPDEIINDERVDDFLHGRHQTSQLFHYPGQDILTDLGLLE